ncbi:MAG: carboxymuconolactone decarboxylase family protein [Trueperaceae bacterium]|nr:carboxymuconolactone decarboxylase family protein [Trueperaceae bacterium]
MTVRKQIWGDKAEAIERGLRRLDDDLADLVVDVAYDTVMARPGLDLKTRELLAITALLSVGSDSELKTHIYGALNCGATLGEIKETLLQAALFVGFPRAMAGMKVWRQVADRLEPDPSPDTP